MAAHENPWSISSRSCSVPKGIRGVRCCYLLTLPRALFGTSAVSFSQMSGPCTTEWKQIFHVFLELSERVKAKGYAPVPPGPAPGDGEVPADVAAAAGSRVLDDADEESIDSDYDDDDGGRGGGRGTVESEDEDDAAEALGEDDPLFERSGSPERGRIEEEEADAGPSEREEEADAEEESAESAGEDEEVNVSEPDESQEEEELEEDAVADREEESGRGGERRGAPRAPPEVCGVRTWERVTDRCVDMFVEFVRSDGRTPNEIVAYTFFLVVYQNSAADPNEILEDIIGLSSVYARSAASSRDGSPPRREAWEAWKTVGSVDNWARMLDVYTHSVSDHRREQVMAFPLKEDRNPACAKQFFAPFLAFAKRPPMKTAPEQSLSAFNRMFYGNVTTAPDGGEQFLAFPDPRYVYRCGVFDAQSMHDRMLPEYQLSQVNQLSRVFPYVLENVRVTVVEDDDANAGLASHPTHMDTNESRILASRFQDQGQNDDDGGEEGGEGASYENILASAPDKTEHATDASDRRTILNRLAGSYGNSTFGPEGLATLDMEDVGRQRSRLAKSSEMTDDDDETRDLFCGGAYGRIRVSTKKHLRSIQEEYCNFRGKTHWGDLENPDLVARKLSLLVKADAFEQYIRTCRGQFDNLSPSGKKIIDFVIRDKLYEDHGVKLVKFDRTLCAFANAEALRYAEFKNVYGASGKEQAKAFGKADNYSLDAYTVDFNRIHCNMMTTSERGGLGKSLVWSILEQYLRIPGTVTSLTYNTAKARATEKPNQNDGIVVYDEIKAAQVSKDDKFGGDEERMMKELMTRNKVEIMFYFQDPVSGERITKRTYAEWITVFFASNNLENLLSQLMSDAMESRWDIVHFDESQGKNRGIAEAKLAEIRKSTKELDFRPEVDRKNHLTQALFFEACKLIYCGGLSAPTMDVASIVLYYMCSWLHENGYVKPEVRQIERVVALANIKVIRDAICTVFLNAGSKYEGRSIDPENLKDLDRHLKCQLKHIISAIGEAADVLLDPLEMGIRKALRFMHKRMMNYGYKSFAHTAKSGVVGASRKQFQDNPTYCNFTLRKIGVRGLAQQVRGIMETEELASTVPSADAIERRFRTWTKRSASYHQFRIKDPEGIPKGPGDDTPEIFKVADSEKTRTVAFLEEHDQMNPSFTVHIQFIYPENAEHELRDHTEVLRAGLVSLLSKRHQRAGRYIFCSNKETAEVLEIIQVPEASPDAPLICLPQTSRMSDMEQHMLGDLAKLVSESRGSDYFAIGKELDTLAVERRDKDLYISELPVDPQSLKESPFGIITRQRELDMTHDSMFNVADDDEGCGGEDDCGAMTFSERTDAMLDAMERERPGNAAVSGGTSDGEEERTTSYFMGTNIRELYQKNDPRCHSLLNADGVKTFYKSLDKTPARGCKDVDFDPELYVVAKNDADAPIYHWQVLAAMHSPVSYEAFVKEDPMLPAFCRIAPSCMAGLSESQKTVVKAAVEKRNSSKYKMFCTHPVIQDHLLNTKLYSSAEAEKDLRVYPGDMLKGVDQTLERRFRESQTLAELGVLEVAMKQDPQKCSIEGYRLDVKRGRLVREWEGADEVDDLMKTIMAKKKKTTTKKKQKRKRLGKSDASRLGTASSSSSSSPFSSSSSAASSSKTPKQDTEFFPMDFDEKISAVKQKKSTLSVLGSSGGGGKGGGRSVSLKSGAEKMKRKVMKKPRIATNEDLGGLEPF